MDRLPDPSDIKHLPPDGGPDFNRLVFEKSPYLLQHARNPVDWYPWGEEAFTKAHSEDKPVFLSVGYSTCHWCHVMERESFEDAEVAALMNAAFVCIKVDREERPDIDAVYMSVTQALSGHGGWPMTVLLTPDKQPFFAGTYFPKHSRHGRPGMVELVAAIREAWSERRADVVQSAGQIVERLRSLGERGDIAPADVEAILEEGFQQLRSQYDSRHGGFGNAPKFPTPHNLSFLLRYVYRTGRDDARAMAEKTLIAIRRGGIYDHVGFGFHRYSTDAHWFLPHFEKMLYDQALLVMAYTDAYQATGKTEYRATAEEIIQYVLRDLTDTDGGLYSAEDADSEGEEGKFYQWSYAEVLEVLGEKDGKLWCDVYNVREDGNCHDEATRESTGKNIFFLDKDTDVLAHEHGKREEELTAKLAELRRKLFERREQRIHCFKDDKILTDWNGLMIAALARASRAFQEGRYADATERAARFVLDGLRTGDGRLLKRARGGEAGLPAHLEDYAFMTWGLIELYETTFETRWLGEALGLTTTMIGEFHDKESGGFFMTAHGGEELPLRPKEIYDGAIPSGNSVAALNLLRLGRMTGRSDLTDLADGILRAFASQVSRYPMGFCQYLSALEFAVSPPQEIVVAARDKASAKELLAVIQTRFLPNAVVLGQWGDGHDLAQWAPFTASHVALDGKPTVYVCENYACQRPVQTEEEVRGMVGG